MAGMGIGDHLHVGDAAAETPSQCAKGPEESDTPLPVRPAGEQDGGHSGQRSRNHRAPFMAEVAANPPPYRERKRRKNYQPRGTKPVVQVFSTSAVFILHPSSLILHAW